MTERRFRNNSNRVMAVLTWIGAAVIALVFAISGRLPIVGTFVVIAVCAAFTWFAWAIMWRTYVGYRDGVVVVRNPFTTIEIPATEVAGIDGGRYLTVRRHDGTAVRVWAVQAANIAVVLHRRSHSDDVADDLKVLVESGSPGR